MGLHLTVGQQQEVPQGSMFPERINSLSGQPSLLQDSSALGGPPVRHQAGDQTAISPSTSSPPEQGQHLPSTQEKEGDVI